jgi:hypothetical protein
VDVDGGVEHIIYPTTLKRPIVKVPADVDGGVASNKLTYLHASNINITELVLTRKSTRLYLHASSRYLHASNTADLLACK